MPVLKKIFNPVSDSFLLLEEREARRGRFYSVHREMRSPEFLREKQVHSGIFAGFQSRSLEQAESVFNLRSFREKNAMVQDLFGQFSLTGYATSPALAIVMKASNFVERATLCRRFGSMVFAYEVCDSPARKFYAFEKDYFSQRPAPVLTTQKAIYLVRQIERDYKLPRLDVSFWEKPVYQTYLGERREIGGYADARHGAVSFKQQNKRLSKWIVLHEMAHILTDETAGRVISHGRDFAIAATQLYDRYLGLDLELYFGLADDPRYKIFGPEAASVEEVLTSVKSKNKFDLGMDFISALIQLQYNSLQKPRQPTSASYSPAGPSQA